MLLHLEGERACGAITTVAASCLTGLNSRVHMQSVTQTLHTTWEVGMKGRGRFTICLLFVSSPDSTLRITIPVAQVMLGSRGGKLSEAFLETLRQILSTFSCFVAFCAPMGPYIHTDTWTSYWSLDLC